MKITAHDLPLTYWQGIAERNGVTRRAFKRRLDSGWGLERAATTPTIKMPRRPRDPNCITNRAKAAGISMTTIYKARAQQPGVDDDTIIQQILERRRHRSLASLAREAGINEDTFRERIQRGWSLEDAMTKRPMTRRQAGEAAARKRWANRRAAA